MNSAPAQDKARIEALCEQLKIGQPLLIERWKQRRSSVNSQLRPGRPLRLPQVPRGNNPEASHMCHFASQTCKHQLRLLFLAGGRIGLECCT